MVPYDSKSDLPLAVLKFPEEKFIKPHYLQYPRSVAPEFFADHIGNLTVELVLASVEISTLLIRIPPTLETLAILREAEAFPGNDPEGKCVCISRNTALEVFLSLITQARMLKKQINNFI